MHAHRRFPLGCLLLLAALLAALGLPAMPAYATISLVQPLGTASTNSGGSVTIHVTGAVTAGHSIIVAVGTDANAGTITCADAAANAYQTDISDRTFVVTAICSAHNVQALSPGSAIEVTLSGSPGSPVDIYASAVEFAGLAATSPLDRTA